ncbi:serine/arginine-rich splicing factor SR45a [Rosa sericea]
MADSPRRRYSRSPSPWRAQSRSRSRSRSMSRPRSRSRSWSRPRHTSRSRGRSRSRSRGRVAVVNPGNTLYVTGLSQRVSEKDVERHFSKEGKVASCFLVVEPRSRISRGFAFVTMDSNEDAERCIKHLNQSVLEGRYITVERSRRKRPRTPTPGHYLGLKNTRDYARGDRDRDRDRDRGRYRGGSGRDDYGYRRSPRRSPYRGGRDYSPRGSPYGGGRSRRERSYSPYGSPERKYTGRSR